MLNEFVFTAIMFVLGLFFWAYTVKHISSLL